MEHKKISKPVPILLTKSVLFEGDALQVLKRLPPESVPMRSYISSILGIKGLQYFKPNRFGGYIPPIYQSTPCCLFRVRRVLRDDGILWLNIGDGYTSGNRGWRAPDGKNPARAMSVATKYP